MPKPPKSKTPPRKALKPARKHARRIRRRAKPSTPAAPTTRQIHAALAAYRQAQDQLNRCGTEVLALAEHFGTTAVSEHRQRLQNSLFEERLLDDLTDLAQFLSSENGYPGEMPAQYKLLPAALLQWIESHLGLRRHLHIGEEAEIPAAELSSYEVVGTRPEPLPSLVRIRVVRPGWNLDRKPVVLPSVEIV